eukprot:sb/3475951/
MTTTVTVLVATVLLGLCEVHGKGHETRPLLFEGDIVMTDEIVESILRDHTVPQSEKRHLKQRWKRQQNGQTQRTKRAALKSQGRLWGDNILQSFGENGEQAYAIIPYTFDKSVGKFQNRPP